MSHMAVIITKKFEVPFFYRNIYLFFRSSFVRNTGLEEVWNGKRKIKREINFYFSFLKKNKQGN
jgi:hypothetical protein